MIATRKVPWFNFMLRRWIASILRRRFHNVYLFNAQRLDELDETRPVVGCVNHTNWWDGFVLYILSHRRLPHEIYLAMEEENLRRYRFFTWMGVFGIDLAGPRAALAGLRYAVRLLQTRGSQPKLVWIFVQGKLQNPRVLIDVKPGASFLARHAGAQMLPLILRYEWLAESRPSIFVQIGRPLPPETTAPELAGILNEMFAACAPESHLVSAGDCQPLFPEPMSMNKRWDFFVHRLLRRRRAFDKRNR